MASTIGYSTFLAQAERRRFFRRNFIDDVSVEGEFFDEEFFAFREDGRSRLARAGHGLEVPVHARRRRVACAAGDAGAPQNLPLVINWHSAKNRFLMRGKNASGWLCWRLAIPVAWRDLMTFGYAAVRDRRLWSATTYWWRARDNVRRKRAIIQGRRRVSDRDLVWWFSSRPRAVNVEEAVASCQLAKSVAARVQWCRTILSVRALAAVKSAGAPAQANLHYGTSKDVP